MSRSSSKVCSSCKLSKKRNHDGKHFSCFNCSDALSSNSQGGESDRRRRKYHADYIFYLQEKVSKLEGLIAEHDTSSAKFNQLDAHLIQNRDDSPNPPLLFDTIHEGDQHLNSGEGTIFAPLLSELLNLKSDVAVEQKTRIEELDITPLDCEYLIDFTGSQIYHIDETFKIKLIDLARNSFGEIPYFFGLPLTEIEQWDFSPFTPLSRQLIMCSIFAVACIYSEATNANKISKLFVNHAARIAIDACKLTPDDSLIQALLLLSCYEMGMGSDSMSYMYISMACGLTQHMGYHISYDQRSAAAIFAPSISPSQSALLWSVCTQDRLITSKIGVPSCIHFKKIVSPLYQIQRTPSDGEDYITELSFSYTSRLCYLLDRFTDQILSNQSDSGDSQEKHKLFRTAEQCLKDLKSSLPTSLKVCSSKDYHAINFQLNYEACNILLESLLANDISLSSSNKCISSANEISRLINMLFDIGRAKKTSYHFGYICYLAGMVHLCFYIARPRERLESLSGYRTCISGLKASGERWKGSLELLKKLRQFAKLCGVTVGERQEDARYDWFFLRQSLPGVFAHETDNRVAQLC